VRAARVEVDLGAIAHNVALVRDLVAPAEVCAVVKADGYGHGAIAVAEAALGAGASSLAVALVEEGAVLRKAGITAPILLLSQPRLDDIEIALHFDLQLSLYTAEAVEVAADAAVAQDVVAPVHLKVNTGMNRVGAPLDEAVALAKAVDAQPGLALEALWTHCAVADEPDHPFTDEQLDRFDRVVGALEAAGLRPRRLHAANSAAALEHRRARYDMVRCGISLYGIPPSPALAGRIDLRPALTLRAEVSLVKRVRAGEGVSYGLGHTFDRDTTVATVPIGYADGVPRRLSAVGGAVLIGGRRRPVVGVVTMDQLMVDVGDDPVAPGDEVVLLGAQGRDRIDADDWAVPLGTIAYEIVCGIGPRVPRFYRGANETSDKRR
jgi:alanine racemase